MYCINFIIDRIFSVWMLCVQYWAGRLLDKNGNKNDYQCTNEPRRALQPKNRQKGVETINCKFTEKIFHLILGKITIIIMMITVCAFVANLYFSITVGARACLKAGNIEPAACAFSTISFICVSLSFTYRFGRFQRNMARGCFRVLFLSFFRSREPSLINGRCCNICIFVSVDIFGSCRAVCHFYHSSG